MTVHEMGDIRLSNTQEARNVSLLQFPLFQECIDVKADLRLGKEFVQRLLVLDLQTRCQNYFPLNDGGFFLTGHVSPIPALPCNAV